MSNTAPPDDAPVVTDADAEADDGRLHSVVVTYEGTPDRQTLYPPEATETERLTHWLSADAFEHLDERR